MAAELPRLRSFDCSLALLADPYRFIGERCRELNSDVFEARLMLQPTIFLHGAEAAELFYDAELFQRSGAAPEPLRATLFGEGTVQSLDGAMHRQRKALFVAATAPASVDALVAETRRAWQRVVPKSPGIGPVSLYALAREALTRAACAWAGVPLAESEVPLRTRQLTLLFDGAAGGPVQHLRSRVARQRAEAWLADLLEGARAGRTTLAPTSIAALVANHRDADGQPMAPRIAAAELLNLLWPTVAISVFIVFAAHALHEHPSWRARLRTNRDRVELAALVQEVRRFYPFFPAVVARTRREFEWKGHRFPAGRRTMLDLFGTNHDARTWEAPAKFRPERFLEDPPGPFSFVPQGGSTVKGNHRCPGEGITRALMAQAVELLLDRLDAIVAAQDFRVDDGRLPALPREQFMLRRVRWVD